MDSLRWQSPLPYNVDVSHRLRLCASVASGVLLWGSFWPGWSWLVWIACVPLLIALRDVGTRRGAFLGWIFGLVYFGLQLSFVLALWPFAGALIVPAWALLVLYAALFPLVFGGVAGRWSSPWMWAGAFVLVEVVRSLGPLGLTFGALHAALGDTPFTAAAAFGGPWALSLAPAWTSAALAEGLRRPLWLVAAVLGPVVLVLLAMVPLPSEEGEVLSVALLQPNVPQELRLESDVTRHLLSLYRGMLEEVPDGTELVVLPENVMDVSLLARADYRHPFAAAAAATEADLLVGTYEAHPSAMHNVVLWIAPTEEVAGVYAKTHLVPFGEYLPGRALWDALGLGGLLAGLLPYDLAPGDRLEPLARYGVMICFESQVPGIARTLVRRGARLLVVPTNDAWFGRARLLEEHFLMGSLRAAEQGRPLVQVGTTGVTGAFDARGRELARLPVGVRAIASVDLPTEVRRTPYTLTGDAPLLAVAALLMMVGLATAKRPRRGRGRGGRM